jgi:adducin
MREMERRKRVEAIMSSKLFREELERVVTDSLRESGADGISDMLSNMLNVRPSGAAGGGVFRPSVVPINDIRGLEGMNFSKSEKLLRCKLAAVYRCRC